MISSSFLRIGYKQSKVAAQQAAIFYLQPSSPSFYSSIGSSCS